MHVQRDRALICPSRAVGIRSRSLRMRRRVRSEFIDLGTEKLRWKFEINWNRALSFLKSSSLPQGLVGFTNFSQGKNGLFQIAGVG